MWATGEGVVFHSKEGQSLLLLPLDAERYPTILDSTDARDVGDEIVGGEIAARHYHSISPFNHVAT